MYLSSKMPARAWRFGINAGQPVSELKFIFLGGYND
jgi:hypothetical protein